MSLIVSAIHLLMYLLTAGIIHSFMTTVKDMRLIIPRKECIFCPTLIKCNIINFHCQLLFLANLSKCTLSDVSHDVGNVPFFCLCHSVKYRDGLLLSPGRSLIHLGNFDIRSTQRKTEGDDTADKVVISYRTEVYNKVKDKPPCTIHLCAHRSLNVHTLFRLHLVHTFLSRSRLISIFDMD